MQIFMAEFKWKRDTTNWSTGQGKTFVHRKRTFLVASDAQDAAHQASKILEENSGKFWSDIPPGATLQVFAPGELWSEPVVSEEEDEA
jgi:hypothetical protein